MISFSCFCNLYNIVMIIIGRLDNRKALIVNS